MAVIRKKRQRQPNSISTASLPDIIFMILFFFMVSTTMRTSEELVAISPPRASEVQKLEKKSSVSYILVGEPVGIFKTRYGSGTHIQLNDSFRNVADIGAFIASERDKLGQYDIDKLNVYIKADKGVRMGVISDIKNELRKADALDIIYYAIGDDSIHDQ